MPPVAVNLLSAQSLLSTFGAVGLLVVLFAETGLLIGFFLPGDSLLFTAGFVAAGGVHGVRLSLGYLLPAAVAGALVGAEVGYLIGRYAGPALFNRPDARLFKRSHVLRAEELFRRFGSGKAVVLARFVPVVRTFMNPLAGVLQMPVRDFTVWNVVGGVPWSVGILLLGYFLGTVSFLRGHIEVLVVAVVAISLVPLVIEATRRRPARQVVDLEAAGRRAPGE